MNVVPAAHTLNVCLTTQADTVHLARVLCLAVQVHNPGALLLYGDLGAGKTTLTRMLVELLPGGENAEAASPSFTICNIYCTKPVVHHFDLYRLEQGICDEALEESFDTPSVLTVVEWSERIAPQHMPLDGIACHLSFSAKDGSRQAKLESLGNKGASCLALVNSRLAR